MQVLAEILIWKWQNIRCGVGAEKGDFYALCKEQKFDKMCLQLFR